MNKILKKYWFEVLLTLILTIAIALRLYKYDSPIADWHSWRQADTSSVSRTFVKEGIQLFYPKYDDLSNIASGLENPEGWRMVEFPIYNLWQVLIYKTFTFLNIEESGRIGTALISTVGIMFWALVVRKISNSMVGLLSALSWALMPYAIFYNRVVLPDPMMVSLCIISTYLALKAYESKKLFGFWFLGSSIFASLALLTKPTAVFYLVSQIILIFYFQWRFRVKSFGFLFLFYLVITLGPILWWRELWIKNFPSGIAANSWLLNNLFLGEGTKSTGAWFRWIFYERISLLILGSWNSVFVILGVLNKKNNLEWWSNLLGIAMLGYLWIFANGNVRHDYYQIPLIPILSFFMGMGFYSLWTNRRSLIKGGFLWGICIWIIGNMFAWYQIKGLYQINNPSIIKAGNEANKILPVNAKVIAPYMGDTAFLYQTNRKGWPLITEFPIEKMIEKGATHYISVNYDTETKDIMKRFKVLVSRDDFILVDLTNKNNL